LTAVNRLAHRFELAARSGVTDSSATQLSKAQEQEAVHPVVRLHSAIGR
jgi:hypothetical protein